MIDCVTLQMMAVLFRRSFELMKEFDFEAARRMLLVRDGVTEEDAEKTGVYDINGMKYNAATALHEVIREGAEKRYNVAVYHESGCWLAYVKPWAWAPSDTLLELNFIPSRRFMHVLADDWNDLIGIRRQI